ncbi:MAG: tRNA epoxyqueuosine(34) reductase QueG [Albidovulum sp.]|nr:tRNA epoxyqueuosine(34) reductase QueG [Albidovulum sp.]MDE0531022.1 tRNA epoxyqueuosine(34) reductase QueG [Albidovulum sp.]
MKPIADDLKRKARAEGFDAVGICSPASIPNARSRLAEFLKLKRHGTMNWMERRFEWRSSPSSLWPEARSVVMVAQSYAPKFDPFEILKQPDKGAISAYAQNRDYHDLVKKRLKRVGRWLLDQAEGAEIKVFVDTAPVMEKPLAAAAGIGWQGKHTNLLSRRLGNWFFLGAIFTTIELPFDESERDRCGSCRRCLDICPTNAFPAPYQLDARRCISYLTIEHKGMVEESLRPLLGNRIYGCDDCLAICPWNKFAAAARECRYHAGRPPNAPELAEIVRLDEAGFRNKFRGSPIKRTGRSRIVRNALYAIANSGIRELASAASPLRADPDPVVSDAARWAIARLDDRKRGTASGRSEIRGRRD